MTRNISKTILAVMLAGLIVCIAIAVQAKVPVEAASKLKKELTPTGAERAGNKEGTIPPWTGGLSKIPENVNWDPASGNFRPDPFAEDKILFTITAENVDQYKDKLSAGLLGLFQRYPDTWKMNIYPTRRSAAYSEEIYKGTYDNALTAEVVDRNGSMINYWKGFPFPIPQNGSEAVLNYLARPNGAKNLTTMGNGGIVQANGSYPHTNLVRNRFFYLAEDEDVSKEEFNPKAFTSGLLADFLMAGRKGEIYLLLWRGNFQDDDNGSWSYLPGMRRVRRNPNSFYDGVDPVNGNLATNDDSFMYNGKIDRYDWKLNEKKEMFVPYNNYQFVLERNPDLLLTPKHLNPKYLRWELHRTWEVVATLREAEGYRHIYGKRIFYLDEDTWQLLLRDQYDIRGVLWRTAWALGKQFYDVPAYHWTHVVTLDLQVEAYVCGWSTEPDNIEDIPSSYFTPAYLRKMGTR